MSNEDAVLILSTTAAPLCNQQQPSNHMQWRALIVHRFARSCHQVPRWSGGMCFPLRESTCGRCSRFWATRGQSLRVIQRDLIFKLCPRTRLPFCPYECTKACPLRSTTCHTVVEVVSSCSLLAGPHLVIQPVHSIEEPSSLRALP